MSRKPILVVEPVPDEPALEAVPPRAPGGFKLARAVRTLRALIADPEKTENAVDVIYAVGTRDFERGFRRFVALPDGRRLLARRSSLLAALRDCAALERLPAESFGRAYLAYLDRTGFAADGLVALEKRVSARWEAEEGVPRLDPARAWFRERAILAHDLGHVLTGYGTDELGEATLLAFDWGQSAGFSNGLLTFGASLEVFRYLGRGWIAYATRAWRRGRRARWLVTLPFEELLPLSLETVRSIAAIDPPAVAHPEGIFRGTLAPAA
jgi:ubiquinone biosynthesis protein COQ4